MLNLNELYEGTLSSLPVEAESHLLLRHSAIPQPPIEVMTEDLKVVPRTLGHNYGDCSRYDVIHFFSNKLTYRRLGLLLLGSMFHPNRQTTVYLRHPETKVGKLRICCSAPDASTASLRGLASIPVAYGYEAAPVRHSHPLWKEEWRIEGRTQRCSGRSAWPLPFVYLTNESGRCGIETDFEHRNIVDGFGGPEATATLAALLLDIGLPQTELTEFCLEGPAGNWSVDIGSAEATFWIGYDRH